MSILSVWYIENSSCKVMGFVNVFSKNLTWLQGLGVMVFVWVGDYEEVARGRFLCWF